MAMGTAAVRPIPEGAASRTAESTTPTVSIVMPCLNEEETVGTCVEKAMSWLARTRHCRGGGGRRQRVDRPLGRDRDRPPALG